MRRDSTHTLESRLKISTAAVERERAKKRARAKERTVADELEQVLRQNSPSGAGGAVTSGPGSTGPGSLSLRDQRG
jgi:hypothetical protein